MDDLTLERQFAACQALVVDDSALARDVLTSALRTLGVSQVTAVSRISEARRRLLIHRYDVVLCDYHFSASEGTGQDLLEDIREQRLLPLSAIFIMVTGEAAYEKVVEVAETAPDDYLLKPFTAEALFQRLLSIARRKIRLAPIHAAVEAGDDEAALAASERLVAEGGPYRAHAVRYAAELCVRLRHHARARELYDDVLSSQAIPWAKIGLARIDHAQGDTAAARGALEVLVEEQPSYVDAYDMLGRVLLESSCLDGALDIYRRAIRVTPGSVRRLQQFGALAFALGDGEEAAISLRKAVRLGTGSRTLNMPSIVMLALLLLDRDASREIERLRATLESALEASPGDARLPLLILIVDCSHALAARIPGRAVELAQRVCGFILKDGFDMEVACVTVALLARLRRRELDLADAPAWLRDIGLRFISSQNALALLAGCARMAQDTADALQAAHAEVNVLCNDAMSLVLDRRAQEGVRMLLKPAASHGNARVLGLIRTLSQKHLDEDPVSFGRTLELAQRLEVRHAGRTVA